jgi:N-acetylglucosaminyldiphosphoundecaprenol N-acetyl-beta-D-mannosaminyltransferase
VVQLPKEMSCLSAQNEAASAPGHSIPRTPILGVGVSALDMATAVATVEAWIERREWDYVCVSTVHSIMECRRDPELRRIHNDAGLVTPDGMPLVWLSRLWGFRHVERVYGPDLMLALCKRSLERGWRHFLYGGTAETLALLEAALRGRFPGLSICGSFAPPFRPLTAEEDCEVVERINLAKPDIVWVGLGCPKQERWMAGHKGRVRGVLVGVGAAFDFLAGLKPQAPRWMQRAGLEWAFRLATEPRRLWRRYIVLNPLFIAAVARELVSRRGFLGGRYGGTISS